MQDTNNKLKWCSLFKVLVILIICAVQVLIIKGYFNREYQRISV